MKPYKKFLIAFMIFNAIFSFNIKAYAEDCGDLSSERCRIGERGVIKVAGNGNLSGLKSSSQTTKVQVSLTGEKSKYGNPVTFYKTAGITITYKNEALLKSYYSSYQDSYSALFCMDAQYEGYNPLYAERFLIEPTYSKKVQAFDVAVMSVLTANGGYMKSVSNSQDYWARLMAIRAITYTFGFYNDSSIEYVGAFYAGLTTTRQWNDSNPAVIASLNAALVTYGGNLEMVPTHTGYYFSGAPVETSKSYYYTALQEAADYLNSLADTPTVKDDILAGDIDIRKDSETDEFAQVDIEHTLTLSNFNKDNKFIINKNTNGVKLAKEYEGLTAYISQIEIEEGPIFTKDTGLDSILDQDLVALGYIKEDSDTIIKVTVHLEGWKKSSNPNIKILKCDEQPIKYSIDGTYDTGVNNKYKDYVATVWYSGESKSQRYVGIEKRGDTDEDDGTPWESKEEIPLIEACECTDFIEACRTEAKSTGNFNGSECKKLKDSSCGECAYLQLVCDINSSSSECDEDKLALCDASCDTFVDTYNCCDVDNNLLLVSTEEKEVSILGPGKDNPDSDSIKMCFVNKVNNQKDNSNLSKKSYEQNGYRNANGIKDQKDNSYTLKNDSKYCLVSCKEDYVMTMPTSKLVNAGGYFTFKANITNTKTCVTNKIDIDQYNEDMEDIINDMVDAYNNYLKRLIAYEQVEGTAYQKYDRVSGSCDADVDTILIGYETEFEYQKVTVKRGPSQNNLYTFTFTTAKDTYDYEAEDGITDGGEDGYTAYKCCGACVLTPGCCNPGTKTGYSGIRGYASNVKTPLKTLIDEYKTEFEYLKDLYLKLQEEYKSCSDDSWSSAVKYEAEVYYDYAEDYLMEHFNKHYGEMEGGITSSYSDDTWYCGKDGLNDANYSVCTNNNTANQTIDYVECTLGSSSGSTSCKIEHKSMPTKQYVKKTSEVVADYKPATLFYQTWPGGEITTNSSSKNAQALVNSLPVSINTSQNMYYYNINIKNIGEFYQTKQLGRYVGSSSAVVDSEVLTYACSYLVNMGIIEDGMLSCTVDNCPDACEVECLGPNCSPKCISPYCKFECIGVGCVYDAKDGNFIYTKEVSLNNVFPGAVSSIFDEPLETTTITTNSNQTITHTKVSFAQLLANSTLKSVPINWSNSKAEETISNIEELGNAIYNEEPILSLTITPKAASEIRKYNYSKNKDYTDTDTMNCYDLQGYENIACYSSFITELLEGRVNGYNLDIVNDNSQVKSKGNYRVEVDNSTSNYFQTYHVSGKLGYPNTIGPSWK